MSEKLAYTKAEAARVCGVSTDTIDRAIKTGELDTVSPRVNGRHINKVLIMRSELERWLNQKQGEHDDTV